MIRIGEYNLAIEATHWWWRGRRAVVSALLDTLRLDYSQTRILDIGCGSGGNMSMLARYGHVLGIDPNMGGLNSIRGHWALPGDISEIATPDQWVDLVVTMDVLEHIEDDGAALREIWRVLRPGGYLVVTVPAHQALWSAHDVSLGHVRRYSRANLMQTMADNLFDVLRASYFVSMAFPGVAAYRLLFRNRDGGQVETPSGPINAVMSYFMTLEAMAIKRADLPVGTSILALGQKPK